MPKVLHLFLQNEQAFEEVFQNANFRSFIFRIRVKLETYNVSGVSWGAEGLAVGTFSLSPTTTVRWQLSPNCILWTRPSAKHPAFITHWLFPELRLIVLSGVEHLVGNAVCSLQLQPGGFLLVYWQRTVRYWVDSLPWGSEPDGAPFLGTTPPCLQRHCWVLRSERGVLKTSLLVSGVPHSVVLLCPNSSTC